MQRIKKKINIMDENDSLSEYNKIPLGHNRTGFVRGLTKSYKVLYLFLKNKTSYKVLYFIEGIIFF